MSGLETAQYWDKVLSGGLNTIDKFGGILSTINLPFARDLTTSIKSTTTAYRNAESIYVKSDPSSAIGTTFSLTPFKSGSSVTTSKTAAGSPAGQSAGVSQEGGLLGGLGGILQSPLLIIGLIALVALKK